MVFWKIFQRAKNFILSFSFDFLLFSCIMNIQKAQKNWTKHDHLLLFKKRFMRKVLNLLLNAINVEKKIPTFSLEPSLFPNFFSGWYINISQRKPWKTWAINEKFSKNSIFMGKHGWHPLNVFQLFYFSFFLF